MNDDFFDNDFILGAFVVVDLDISDGLNDIHSLNDLPKHGIPLIKVRLGF